MRWNSIIKRLHRLFAVALVAALVFPFAAFADDISNNLDASVDATAEVMSLNVGGANGTTQLYVVPTDGDGKNGCNLTGSTTLVVAVSSSNTAVATVSPASVTFTSCSDTRTLTVTPVAQGTATISVSETSNSTGRSFNLAPARFTVNVAGKADQAITFNALTDTTFGAPAFALSATASSGLPVSFAATGPCAISNNQLSITGAGSCTITASQAGNNNYNAAQPVQRSFTIAKADQTIDFTTPADKTFGAAAFALSASASSGLPVSFTAVGPCAVSNGQLSITGAGSCTITASQAGNDTYNVAPSVERQFNIAKAQATVSLGSLEQTYNGSARPVSVTTTPANLPVDITYDSASAAPTNAGSYGVVATINHTNYQGSASDTLMIGKANAVLSLDNLTHTYDGSSKAATATTNPAGLAEVAIAYSQNGQPVSAPINAGSYAVVASLDNLNYAGSGEGTLVIAKADQTITFNPLADTTFGAAAFALSATASSGLPVSFAAVGPCAISDGQLSITGAGSCTITASQAGNDNYNAANQVTRSFTIAKAPVGVTLSNVSFIYDGSPKTAIASTSRQVAGVSITYNGSTQAPTAVGSYAVVATINDPNYQGQAAATLVIAPWTVKGFYSPVDMTVSSATPVYNTTKGGNTVPLKFELFRGAAESSNTADVKSLVQATVNCQNGTTSDEVEATSTGSTVLRYDSTSGMFIYNWKTPTGAACFKVTVTMQDGTALHAYFQTRK